MSYLVGYLSLGDIVLEEDGIHVNNPEHWAHKLNILDNTYVIVEYDHGSLAILDLCVFAEGGKNG